MIENLPGVPLVDQLPAVRAIVEMIAFVCRLGALPLAGDRWAEIGKLRHGFVLQAEGVFESMAALLVGDPNPNDLVGAQCHLSFGSLAGRTDWGRRIDQVSGRDGVAFHLLNMIRGHRLLLIAACQNRSNPTA